MSKHKYTTAVCLVIVIAILTLTTAFLYSPNWGVLASHKQPEYANKLFSTDKVHTIDIIVKESDWEDMLANAREEEYIQASVVIDGDTISGVGIRPKGNSSLSMIESSDSDRYSFKIEFDHYSDRISYYGLDKLALNNIAQDNTYMKDYITYQMMNEMGADAPLSSFIWVTVNGQDWGLYLAAEGIEESFAQREYGNNFGEIYKPDTLDMNAGGGLGGEGDKDNFPGGQMPNLGGENGEIPQMPNSSDMQSNAAPGQGGQNMNLNNENGAVPQLPHSSDMQSNAAPGQGGQNPNLNNENGAVPQIPNSSDIQSNAAPGQGGQSPNLNNESGEIQQLPEFNNTETPTLGGSSTDPNKQMPNRGGNLDRFSDSSTSLIYSDDDPDSYDAIFDNAVFKVSEADKKRLIESLKQLNEGVNIEEVVDVDEVIRYFVVHNFVLNSDSYTGSMIHNYYLAENDGKLRMIAWDYNLAFGGMGGLGGGMDKTTNITNSDQTESISDTATTLVNYPIDSPLLSGSLDSRPMISWIFNNEEYLTRYHEIFTEYMEYFSSGKFTEMYDKAITLISPYVEKDPTAFCTYEEFTKANMSLRQFCLLRAESISGQLDGTIASTSQEQATTNNSGFVDASDIDLESMGSNSMSFNRARVDQFSNWDKMQTDNKVSDTNTIPGEDDNSLPPSGQEAFPDGNPFTNMGMQSVGPSETSPRSVTEIILLVCSILVLLSGLLFAKKKKR